MFVSLLHFSALLLLMSPWQNCTEVKEWPWNKHTAVTSSTTCFLFIAEQSEKTNRLNMEYWASLDIIMNVSIAKCLLNFNDSGHHDLGFCLIQNMHFPFKINWYTTRVKVFIETNLGWV